MNSLHNQIINLLRESASNGALPAHIATMPLLPETALGELGIDSLGKMGLLSALMDLTDKYLADDAIKDENTLSDIVTLLS